MANGIRTLSGSVNGTMTYFTNSYPVLTTLSGSSSLSYQPVTYIESTGTQWINTDIVTQSKSYIKGSFQLTDTTNQYTIYGSAVASKIMWLAANVSVQKFVYYNSNNSYEGRVEFAPIDTNRHSFSAYYNKIIFDGTTYTISSYVGATPTLPVYLFKYNYTSDDPYYAHMKLYSFSISANDAENTLLRDYVPCYLTKSVTDYWGNTQAVGTIGLWDKVSNKFFPNNGTGTFTKGEDVEVISGTGIWNTTYILGEAKIIDLTIPAYNVNNGTQEIRVYFTTGSSINVSINTSNFTTVYGLNDIEFEAWKSYELSFVPLNNSILTVTNLVNKVTPPFDELYTRLEYIANTTTQYIDTGLINSTTIGVEVKFKSNFTGSDQGLYDIFGAQNTTSPYSYFSLLTQRNGTSRIDMESNSGSLRVAFDNNIHTVKMNYEQSGRGVIDGVDKGAVTVANDLGTNYHVMLMADNLNGTVQRYGYCNVYYAKFTQNGSLVRDFIPVIRKADGAVGFYDLCESESPFDGTAFYGNSGTGVFLPNIPSDISHPLYNQGNEYSSVTGGWTVGFANNYMSATKQASQIYLQTTYNFDGNNRAWAYTTNKIDITNYNRLYMYFANTGNTTTETQYWRAFGIASGTPSYGCAASSVFTAYWSSNSLTSDGLYSVDISDFTGSYYITMINTITRNTGIQAVWLE